MFYIIGLGLNEKGISAEGKTALKKCHKVYLENYTIEFPYKLEKLEKLLGKKVKLLNRDDVENNKIIFESKKKNTALLIYGSPFFATTHITLIKECIDNEIEYKIIYSSSVFEAVAESGLQLYKFGKIASMPKWEKNFKPDSFVEIIKENRSINAHSLILIDIGLSFNNAIDQLIKSSKTKNFEIENILVCSQLGFNSKFYYGKINRLKNKKIKAPFCFVIPGKMHFLEEEILKIYEM